MALSRADGKVIPVAATTFDEFAGRLSPDGKWIAYASNESGKNEVNVQRFPPAGGGKWQISVGGGSAPFWKRDGTELFYRTGDKFLAVPVNASQTFEARAPVELFETRTVGALSWTPSADGKGFLVSRPIGNSDPSPITVIVNWTEGLKK